jgi:hypothetical protein
MRVVNTEQLWELRSILKLDLFAQCLGQAALHTSVMSRPQMSTSADRDDAQRCLNPLGDELAAPFAGDTRPLVT